MPPPKYRERFIDYLCDFLNLGEDRERFDAVWTTLSEEWDWDQPTAQELRQYFPPTSVAYIDETGYETSKSREYHLFGVPLWVVYEYKGKREYRILGMRLWSSSIPARYLITLSVVAVLIVGVVVAKIVGGGDPPGIATPTAVQAAVPTMVPTVPPTLPVTGVLTAAQAKTTPTIWNRREKVDVRCEQHDYSLDQGNTKIEVCAWLNVDYTNYRVRAYGSVRQLEGPKATLSASIRLYQDKEIVGKNSVPWTNEASIRPNLTGMWSCVGGKMLASEVEARITYADGQQRTYTIQSEGVASDSCKP